MATAVTGAGAPESVTPASEDEYTAFEEAVTKFVTEHLAQCKADHTRESALETSMKLGEAALKVKAIITINRMGKLMIASVTISNERTNDEVVMARKVPDDREEIDAVVNEVVMNALKEGKAKLLALSGVKAPEEEGYMWGTLKWLGVV